mmetsp:Transcript_26340/g.39055  ORF Transcript_26340/g.39055 Transcript_26340/m.39055 type:complete len:409 (+) Transcript_26340:49-1275(+)
MILLILASLLIGNINAVPFDLIRKEYIDYNWLEVGFRSVEAMGALEWTSVTTESVIPIDEAVAFISIPDVADVLNSEWYPAQGSQLIPPIVPKMNGRPVRNEDGTFTFEFKLVFPNDSYCSKEWFVPVLPPVPVFVEVAWLLGPEGAYNILANYTDENFNTNFIIGSGNITRASAEPIATNSNGNAIQLLYPSGCDSEESICTVSELAGCIQQLQTSVNTIDNGKDLFLSVRAWQVKVRSVWFVLVPHDSHDASYFEITTPEVVAYVVFPTESSVICVEGFAFETRTFFNVTSYPIPLSYINSPYDYPPGIFGMLGSVHSLVDSTTLSVYERNVMNSIFVTKEDQCTTEQTEHITKETVHVLIVGELAEEANIQCNVKLHSALNTSQPTNVPTAAPTPSVCIDIISTH